MTISRLAYLLFTPILFLTACGPNPSEPVEAESDTRSVAKPDALPAEQDQVYQTTYANPQAQVEQELLDEPIVEDVPDVRRPAPAPASPKPPVTKPDGTRTREPVVSNAPPPSPAPAPVAKEEAPAEVETEVTNAPAPPDHEDWDGLLQRFVTDRGDVDYAGFKNASGELDAYLDQLRKATPDGSWGRKEAMAYWINAYNAFTIKRILDNYPISSIQDLDGGDPWKVKWIELDGQTYSLNQIEHDILRPQYKDARIHFAVNCAAASCPPIPNQAFTAANLDRMLENNTLAFIRNSDYNRIGNGKAEVSKIFDWYGEDFGDLKAYLNKYLATPIGAGTEITYADYDWSLNKQ